MSRPREDLKSLIRQEEGVQLWEVSPSGYLVRSLRTDEISRVATTADAIAIYKGEVEKSRVCAVVQKKLGA